MGLKEYKRKRNFKVSSEPGGKKGNKKSTLKFVVQKHAASRLHYDFRLEVDGVLKSWAVPKGPSLNPTIKRLAVHVEDHPVAYADFEGQIPKGEYGAGKVIVWDNGEYTCENPSRGIKDGKLSLILEGKKLKGRFSLFKTKQAGEDSWLLVKVKDQYAEYDEPPITDKIGSVISRKRIPNEK